MTHETPRATGERRIYDERRQIRDRSEVTVGLECMRVLVIDDPVPTPENRVRIVAVGQRFARQDERTGEETEEYPLVDDETMVIYEVLDGEDAGAQWEIGWVGLGIEPVDLSQFGGEGVEWPVYY